MFFSMFFKHQEQHRKAYLESLALGLVEPPVFFLALLAWVEIMKDTNAGKRPRKVKEHRSNLPSGTQCRGWRGSPCTHCTLSSLSTSFWEIMAMMVNQEHTLHSVISPSTRSIKPIVSGKSWQWWLIITMVNHEQPLFLGITGYSTELPQMGVQAYSYDDIFTDDHMTKSWPEVQINLVFHKTDRSMHWLQCQMLEGDKYFPLISRKWKWTAQVGPW